MQSILFANHAIPLHTVLKYCPEFGSTLAEYMTGDNCQWPVINSDGDLIIPESLSNDSYHVLTGSTDTGNRSSSVRVTSTADLRVDEATGAISLLFKQLYIDFRQFEPLVSNDRRMNQHDVLTYAEVQFSDFKVVNDSDGCYYRGTASDSDNDSIYCYYDRRGLILTAGGSRSTMLKSAQTAIGYNFHPQDLYNKVDPCFEVISSIIKKYEDEELAVAIENSQKPQRKTRKAKATMTTATGGSLGSVVKSTVTDNIIEPNKAAALAAGKLEIGSLALDLMTEQVIKLFPEPMQILIGNSPALKIVVSNIVNLLITQFGIDDPRALAVNEAMMTVAWMEAIKQFDIKSMLDDVMSKLPAAKLAALVGSPKV